MVKELVVRVELCRAIGLFEHLVDIRFQVKVELLEQVFEQESEELAREFQTLVTDVIAVVHLAFVEHADEDAADHGGDVHGLVSKVAVLDGDVCHNDGREYLECLVTCRAPQPHAAAHDLDACADVVECLAA